MRPLTDMETWALGSMMARRWESASDDARASGSGERWVVTRMFLRPARSLTNLRARGRWRAARSAAAAEPAAVSTQDSTKEVIGGCLARTVGWVGPLAVVVL